MANILIKQGREIAGSNLVTPSTKADKTDLTSIIQTGTVSTQVISAGTYFYLNDVLVKAKVDIANGATFTLNTNYEVVTAGALNELRGMIKTSTNIVASGTHIASKTFTTLPRAISVSSNVVATNSQFIVGNVYFENGSVISNVALIYMAGASTTHLPVTASLSGNTLSLTLGSSAFDGQALRFVEFY